MTASSETRSRTITWQDPAILRGAAAELDGRAFLQAIQDGRLPPPPMAQLVGARLAFVGDGEVRFMCAPDESTYNPQGMVHGGLLCIMLDTAAGCAVQTLLPAATGQSSIEIKVSFLKALHEGDGEIEVSGRALRVGGRIAFAEAHARNDIGELVGHATTSLALFRAEHRR
jgi:uncharacterized protein (TIGR00369 family)